MTGTWCQYGRIWRITVAIYWDVSTGIWWHLGGMRRDIMASELDMEGNGGNNMGCGGKEPLRMSDCLTVLLLIVVILSIFSYVVSMTLMLILNGAFPI